MYAASNNKPSGFRRYTADIGHILRIKAVLRGVSFRQLILGRGMMRAGAALAALAICACAVTPADASLTRRMKFRAEQDSKRDTGPQIPPGQLHIMISIKSQRIAVYSDGVLAAKSAVSTGVPDHPTPTGVFSIIQKNRHHRSNIYSGAPMPFMQRITWSGVAMHQGVLPGRPASHGCIRLTADFAQRMWKRTRLGARVIITRDDVEPYAFSHPKLFAPKALMSENDAATPVKTAQAETMATDVAKTAANEIPMPDYPPIADVTADIRKAIHDENPNAKKLPVPSGPVSVFISRKERKLYVRQGFVPLFETLVTISDDTKAFGTHVFTATASSDKVLKWVAVSLPVDTPKARAANKAKPERERDRYGRNIARYAPVRPAAAAHEPLTPSAASVLDRIEIPKDAIARIEALMGPGASLVIADSGLGDETGEGTDFIVLTR
jgi:hypothetical protein